MIIINIFFFFLISCSHVNKRTQYENPVTQAKKLSNGSKYILERHII